MVHYIYSVKHLF
jgi:hypothetical protein